MSDPQTIGEFLLYQTEDATTRIQVRFSDNGLWLTQQQLSDLYQSTPQNMTQHIRAIYADGELLEEATCKPYLQVRHESGRQVNRSLKHYNLDMVLAIGYRVRSHRGAQFRRWATDTLKSYLVKGFVLDDERFKSGKDDAYFEELLARIRDIRTSEKLFWKKVLDIYATSIDYDASTDSAQRFFATVQNKMHWAAHGHTAAELISLRADADSPNMGLTTWASAYKGGAIRKADVSVAKNYLNEEELGTLNRIVNAYIEIAELQAQARKVMTMADWMTRLNDFLRMTEREVLTHAGKVAAELAQTKAEAEFEQYRTRQLATPNLVERDFDAAIQIPVKVLAKNRTPNKLATDKKKTKKEDSQ
ncbi:MAG: virulence RhuM family protein [bacterium]|nr:virulence RhuM family protein [bacterium]